MERKRNKERERERASYSGRKDLLRTGEPERKGGRLYKHILPTGISYSALIVFLVVLSSYHKS